MSWAGLRSFKPHIQEDETNRFPSFSDASNGRMSQKRLKECGVQGPEQRPRVCSSVSCVGRDEAADSFVFNLSAKLPKKEDGRSFFSSPLLLRRFFLAIIQMVPCCLQ